MSQTLSSTNDKSPIASSKGISDHDQKILSIISNGVAVDGVPRTTVDMSLAPDQHVDIDRVEQLVKIEKKAILLEKDNKAGEALDLLNQIIHEEPQYASAYNNRAQMRRLVDPGSHSVRAAIDDLESAVALARPAKTKGNVSKMQAQVLRNSYGQLAAIYLQQSKKPENSSRSWDLQLKASDMMVEASNYGEQIATSLAINMNPYSRLCGNMVETVLAHYQ